MPHSRKASNSALDVLQQIGPGASMREGLRQPQGSPQGLPCGWLSPGGHLCLGDEGRGVLLHQSVLRGLLGAAALVVNRGTVGRLARLLHRGLHALLMSRPWCLTVSNRAVRRHCP